MKQFFWQDKTGRGFTNTLTSDEILAFDDEEDEDGNSLHEYVEESEIGDKWVDRTMKYTRIQ